MSNIPKFKDESLGFKERAEDLVSSMTVEECASQMLYQSAEIKRLGVRYYNWWSEALHGVARAGMATVFPQAIGLASTFDDELVYKVADAISTEGRAKYNQCQKQKDYDIYKGLTFWSPNINIFRDPRWGRGQETYGEDPYLTSRLGVAFVKGMQGGNGKYLKTAACAKHFAVHSGPEDKRHEFNAIVSKKDMAETYLPAFKALVDAGVEGFMGAYNRTNGEPCCGSKTLLKDLLRSRWGFEGYITSDCWAISDFHLHHGVTSVPTESVALAVKNGCDLNCGSMYGYLLAALHEGLITEELIRQSAVRLVTTRMKLGMFDKKTPFDDIPYDAVDCDEHRKLNYEVACRSMVLLKNNGILPLDKIKLKNVAVIGPNANSITALEGNYHGTANQYHTVLEAIREALPGVRVNYSKGCHLYDPRRDNRISEAKIQSEIADVVILVVGLDETIEGEELDRKDFTGDKKDLLLPECQRTLIKAVCGTGAPVIIVNMSGSAIDFDYGNDHADAVIQAWYPGAMGGKAVSSLIFGEYSPSGRLPVTFYHNNDTLPDFEDYSMEGRTYKFIKDRPLYPFGFGLSYTKFEYSDMIVNTGIISPGEAIECAVKVKNTGKFAGEEVVQLYLRDEKASFRVPHHKLCGIKRVVLAKGEESTVRFTVDPTQMCVIDDEGNNVFESGKFTLFAGGCQPDGYSMELACTKCASVEFEML